MAPSLDPLLSSYIDLSFNASLGIILALTYVCAIHSQRLLLLVVFVVSAVIVAFDTTSTVGSMIKIMCELPLGLGSVLAFLVTNLRFRSKHLRAFTNYVNFAVYGNIGMMVATPTGGTLRGVCSKLTCIALFTWIIQQGSLVKWKTITLHDNMFVFTAVSKSWIFSHAIYRFILLTLPSFGSGRRFRLLELYSLTLTYILSMTFDLPFEYCFGMADTLVVPTAAGLSAIATTFNLIPRYTIKNDLIFGQTADMYLSVVSLAVALFVCFKISQSHFQSRYGVTEALKED
jgi:hypothetical protein